MAISSSSSSGRFRAASGAAVLVVVAALWIAFSGMTPKVEPLPPSEFAACTFETLPDRTPIGDVFEMTAGAGTYAEIRIVAAKDYPDAYEGADVVPFQDWPVSLWIYPLGKNMIDGYCAGTRRYASERGEKPRPFLSRGGHYWGYQETGYKGDLPRPKDYPNDPNMIVCWTYVSTMPGQTGDLLYEVSVYPTAIPGPGVAQHRYGKRAILKRGVLRVQPVESPATAAE